ncbi:c-type cytochrome [Brucella cytisi]|uniref:c-type cytochrome n=1 Tax=Brucella cytisi TaxID=407152 RepID=UPI0035E130FE
MSRFASLFASIFLVSTTYNVPAQESGDPVSGEKIFKRCSICHKLAADENRRGPLLEGIVGRPAASASDYPYSDAMRAAAAGGLVWTEEQLALFLKRPQGMIKGTWMAFPGLGKSKEIRDVIAYLRQHQN